MIVVMSYPMHLPIPLRYARIGSMHARAFTLIELLVVVSIIAVLASMLLPAIGLVRQQARSIICSSSLRQLQMANIGYAGDSAGLYVPTNVFGTGAAGSCGYWTGNVDFLERLEAGAVAWNGNQGTFARGFLCPLVLGALGSGPYYYVFGANATMLSGTELCSRTSSIRSSSNIIAFADGLDTNLNQWSASSYWMAGGPAPEGIKINQAIAYRHAGWAMAVMFDGHTERFKLTDLSPGMNHWK